MPPNASVRRHCRTLAQAIPLVRGPGYDWFADLPFVAERIGYATELPAVLICDRRSLGRSRLDRALHNRLWIVDHKEHAAGCAVDRAWIQTLQRRRRRRLLRPRGEAWLRRRRLRKTLSLRAGRPPTAPAESAPTLACPTPCTDLRTPSALVTFRNTGPGGGATPPARRREPRQGR